MSDDGQTPTPEATPQDGTQQFDSAYVEKLRKEAANYRTKMRELEAQLNKVAPIVDEYQQAQAARQTESEKLSAQIAALRAEAETAKQLAARAARENKLIAIAAEHGVPAAVLKLLNVDAFDLDDPDAMRAALQPLAGLRSAGGASSNAPRDGNNKQSDAELRAYFFGGGRSQSSIFGS